MFRLEKNYSCFASNSFVSSLVCGIPYITLVISTYTKPLFNSGRKLYYSIISCGMCFPGILIYSGQSIGLLR